MTISMTVNGMKFNVADDGVAIANLLVTPPFDGGVVMSDGTQTAIFSSVAKAIYECLMSAQEMAAEDQPEYDDSVILSPDGDPVCWN